MRDGDVLGIRGGKGEVQTLFTGNGTPVLTVQRFPDGHWLVRRSSDGRRIAGVRSDGLGGVSRSFHLDANHLARVIANLASDDTDRACRLASVFVTRHRSVVFGVE